jgi:opacity protein-like surface antigen
LRYAEFKSQTVATMSGVGDRVVPDGWFAPGYSDPFHKRDSTIDARREFKGAGPVISWDASLPLLGSDASGRMALDWSISGGILFGDRDTRVRRREQTINELFRQTAPTTEGRTNTIVAVLPAVEDEITRSSRKNATTFGASLGLSYSVQRIKIDAGYRWEVTQDVLDAGFDVQREVDRTIDGPYFKIAVGFGG